MNLKQSPYLSIVIAVRNDNYGGDFLNRLQHFITWNSGLLEKHKIKSEIILVNWNPVSNTKSIKDSINWLKNRNFVTYRIITVSKKIHEEFVNTSIRKTVPLFEFIAKNVGVRRSNGEFVLTTNTDILIAEKIVKHISKNSLSSNTLYRANRFDFKPLDDCKLFNQENIEKNTSMIHLKGFSYKLRPQKFNRCFYLKMLVYNWFRTSYCSYSPQFEKLLNKLELPVFYDNYGQKFHSLCSGDFLLMSKLLYLKLQSFEEETWISTHTDALFVAKCFFNNSKITTFYEPIYHQDHTRRFNDSLKNEGIDSKKMLDYFKKCCEQMDEKDQFITENDNDWGLFKLDLNEDVV